MQYGSIEKTDAFIKNGGASCGVVPVSHTNIKDVAICLKSGEDVRHSDDVHELFMFGGDRQKIISAMSIGVDEFTRDTPVSAFWSESPIYAEYLFTSFENAWAHAIPAEERVTELLAEDGARPR